MMSMRPLPARFLSLLLSLSLFSLPIFSHAESVTPVKQSFKLRGVTVDFKVDKSGNAQLHAKVAGSTRCEIHQVSEPSRIVVDFISKGLTKKISLDPNPYLYTIRFGSHPDRLRMVLDLATEDFPEYNTKYDNDEVTLTFSLKSSGKMVKSVPEDAPPPSHPLSSTTTTTVQRVIVAPATPSPTSEASVAPTAPPTPLPIKESGDKVNGLALTGLAFDYASPVSTPMLKISLNGTPEFKLIKRSEKEYRLIIQGCKITERHHTLPQYPPQDFDGFTFVSALQKDDNAEITVGIERGTKITPFVKDQDIWVKATAQ